MTRRTLVALLAVAGLAAAAPSAAQAGSWNVTPTVVNATGSTTANCPASMGFGAATPTGCVVASDGAIDDGDWLLPIPHVIPAVPAPGDTGAGAFTAPNLAEGADAFLTYTMPDGSAYRVTFEDDQSTSDGDGNYAACTETTAQGSAYSCDPSWGSSPPFSAVPTVTFWPVAAAGNISTGQQCASALTAGQTFSCVGTGLGQFAPVRNDNNITSVYYENLSSNATTMDAATISPCVMASAGDMCHYWGYENQFAYGGITITGSGAGDYGIEIVSLSSSPSAPSGPVNTGTGTSSRAAKAGLQSEAIPAGARTVVPAPGVSRLAVAPPGARGGRIAYRTSAAGTTVLTFARRTGRRWVTLPGVARASWLHRAGKPTFTVRGHTASREGVGSHRHAWNGTVGGHRLPPGRYRVTAVSRARGTTRVSRAVAATFTIRAPRPGSHSG